MKKMRIMLFVAFLGFVAYGGYCAYTYITMSDDERFMLANIEALTQNEGSYEDALIENCNWATSKQCDFVFEGEVWINSNMVKIK